ncbi:LOG family protein [Patescibacteria group bacterium]|nr:LOG family protein [Patescibacteria group bacterium]MBU1016281.1 LOG family protein [Patescibacteria group bacterium]MBU1685527.1 LOG family protein [Patescibacteria group bacterium]MBU1938866.1 LOG family protein [Patescibacteria group bacterium]
MDPGHFRVAIFGSARIKPNDPRYNQIYMLAKMIAAEGMDIVTGGGPGLMEAANKGHQAGRKSKKVHSFGLNIMLPKEQKINKHLDVHREFNRFSQRLDYFMHLSNVVVVAPGGIGTLLELMYTWQLIQVEHTCNIPVILMGEMWEPFIKWIEAWPLKKRLISAEDMLPIFLAKHCREAMKVIRKAQHDFYHRGPNYCWNYRKYKIDEDNNNRKNS